MSSALDSIYHIVLTMVYIAALSLLIFAIFANLVENSKYEDPLYWLPFVSNLILPHPALFALVSLVDCVIAPNLMY